jgi:predicted MFS family arabinose efflux permease
VNTPTHPSLLSDWYKPKVLPIIFGWYLVAGAAINIVSGPAAGFLAAAYTWRVAFVVLALPTLVFALLLLRLREPARGESIGLALRRENATGVIRSFRQFARLRSMRRIWLSSVFFGAGLVVLVSLLSLYFQDVWGFGPAARGLITALFGIGGLAGTIWGGDLGRRMMANNRPDRLPLVIALMFVIGLAGGNYILAGAISAPMAIAGVLIASIAFGAWGASYYTQMTLISSPAQRGQAYAWSTIFFSIGAIVASPIIGGVGDRYGQRVAVAVLASLVLIAGLLALRVCATLQSDADATREALAATAAAS